MIARTEFGHLTVGAEADISLWNLMKGDFGYAERVQCLRSVPRGNRLLG